MSESQSHVPDGGGEQPVHDRSQALPVPTPPPPQNSDHHHHSDEEECSICLEAITSNDRVGVIPTCDCRASNQNYHQNCIVKWASNSNSCPQCRKRFYRINIYQRLHSKTTSAIGPSPPSLKLIHSYTVKDKLLKNDAINHIPAEFVIPSSWNEANHQALSLAANNNNGGGGGGNATAQSVLNTSTTFTIGSTTTTATPEPMLNGVCVICSSSNYNFRTSLINCSNCMSNFHYSCINHNINRGSTVSGNGGVDDYFQWCCPICDSDQESLIPYNNRVRKVFRNTLIRTSTNKSRKSHPRSQAFITTNNALNDINDYTTDDFDMNDDDDDDDDDGFDDEVERGIFPRGAKANGVRYDDLMFDDEYNDEADMINETALILNQQSDYYNNTAHNHHSTPIINGGVLLRKELRAQENLTKEELQSWELFDHVRNNDDMQDMHIDKSGDSSGDGGRTGHTNNNASNSNSASGTTSSSISKKRKKRKRKVLENGEDHIMAGTSSTLNANTGGTSHPTRISNLLNQLKTTTTASSTVTSIQPSSSRVPRPAYGYSSPPPIHTLTQNSPIISISESPSSISPMSNSPMEMNDSDTQYESDFSKHRKRHLPLLPPPPPPPPHPHPQQPQRFELTLDQKLEIQKYIRNNLRPLYNPLQINSKIKDENHYININKTISRKIYGHIINESKRNDGTMSMSSGQSSDNENYDDDIDSNVVESYFNQSEPNKLISLVNRYVEEELSKI